MREPANLGERPRPVRQARVVAEVDEVLVRHRHQALVEHGQPADAGVENADRARIASASTIRSLDARAVAAPVRIGTCSWADDALVKHWYPPGTPAARAARLLRRALLDGRGRLDLLPRPDRVDGAGLGRPHARRLRDAREGVRADDPPPGEARAGAARPARRDAGRRPRPRRPAAARGCARASSRSSSRALEPLRAAGQARRDPLPAAALHRAGSSRRSTTSSGRRTSSAAT